MRELETHNAVVHRHKTNHMYSTVVSDQPHEQIYAIVKGKGVADASALRRWFICGPLLT